MCSNMRKLKRSFFLVVASFALVLEAAPQFYPTGYELDQCSCDCYHQPQETRRFIRQPQSFIEFNDQRPSEFFAIDDQDEMNEDFYDFDRLPRSGGTMPSNSLSSIEPIGHNFYRKMNNAAVPTIKEIYGKPEINRYPQYVVRSANYVNDKDYDDYIEDAVDEDISFPVKSARKLNAFPISMMKEEPAKINPGRSLTDEELGKIVRKAITAAKYENFEDLVSMKKIPRNKYARRPYGNSNIAVYRPQDHIAVHNIMASKRMDGTFRNDKSFELEDDEVQLSVVPDIPFSGTQPQTYKFVKTDEESREDERKAEGIVDVIEGDVVLTDSEIESDDEKELKEAEEDELHNLGVDQLTVTTETPTSTSEDYKISSESERDLNSSEEDEEERPPTTTENSSTDETIGDMQSTTPAG